jgi:hypothetical protein
VRIFEPDPFNLVLSFLVAVASFHALAAPILGNGVIVSVTRPSSGITAVRAYKMAEFLIGDCKLVMVNVSPMSEPSVVIEAESNIVPYIQTDVSGETLVISLSTEIQPTRQIVISAARFGTPPTNVKSSVPPYYMRGLGCASDFTMQVPTGKKRSVVISD